MPPQLVDPPVDVSQTLQAILSAVGEKILGDICTKELSLSDLGLVATTLQKLIDCHIELKPFSADGETNGGKTIARDTLDAIQTQLNLF
ncbi:MAG: hypothetical protein LBQ03_00065 [Puniceicoccales bacterium]|jgi:hypothetical protein|nr:hypothetical protein [Puniceicoccales bacterium]